MLQRAGTQAVGVTNPAPGGGSATGGLFTIQNGRPTLSSVTPNSVPVASAALTIEVTGSGFAAQSTVFAGTTPLATTYISATSLDVSIPPASLQTAGALTLTVTNPPPGGGTSGPINFQIRNPAPVLQGVSPTALTASAANAMLTVTGNNFVQGAVVSIGGTALATTFVSSTQLTAVLTAPYPTGNLTVTVTNPAPGGGASNGIPILSSAPPPVSTGGSAPPSPGLVPPPP